jgi:hypothetical protein
VGRGGENRAGGVVSGGGGEGPNILFSSNGQLVDEVSKGFGEWEEKG